MATKTKVVVPKVAPYFPNELQEAAQRVDKVLTLMARDLTSIHVGETADLATHIADHNNPHAVTKAQVGLGNVENTALSTWAGSTNLTTLGTIVTGTWSATAIGATKGGTAQTAVALGDILYGSAANAWSRLPGNTTATRKFFSQTGDGANSAAPGWNQPAFTDITSTLAYAQLPAIGGTWAVGGALSVTGGSVTLGGALLAGTDATYDIGASAASRYRDAYLSRYGIIGVSGAGGLSIRTGAAPLSPLDIVGAGYPGGLPNILLANVVTDATQKVGSIGVRHYTNAEEPFALFNGLSTATQNIIRWGEYFGTLNTATDYQFYTSTSGTNTDVSATLRMVLNATGLTLSRDLLFTDATYDIGKTGAARPRDGFFSRNLTVGGDITLSTGGKLILNGATATSYFHMLSATEMRFVVSGQNPMTYIGLDTYLSTTSRLYFDYGTGANWIGTNTANRIDLNNGSSLTAYFTNATVGIQRTMIMSGDITFIDATYDIGKTGATRPRDGFFSRNLTVGGILYMGTTVTTNASSGDIVLQLNSELRSVASTDTFLVVGSTTSTIANGRTQSGYSVVLGQNGSVDVITYRMQVYEFLNVGPVAGAPQVNPNSGLNIYHATGPQISFQAGSAYSYLSSTSTYLQWSSSNGVTGIKFKINLNAPDDGFVMETTASAFKTHLIAGTDATYDLGTNATTARFRDFFLSRNALIGGTLTVNTVALPYARSTTNGYWQFGNKISQLGATDADTGLYSRNDAGVVGAIASGSDFQGFIVAATASRTSNGTGTLYGGRYSIQVGGSSDALTNTANWTSTVGVRALSLLLGTRTGSSGIVTGAAGIYLDSFAVNGATLTNFYGVYSAAQTAATNNYFLYNAGAAKNELGSGLTNIGGDLTVVGVTTLATSLTGILRADAGVVSVAAGVGARSIFDHFADANNSGTGETDLYSDTLAAGVLAANGDKIAAQYGIVLAGAATATQQVRAYFGGTLVFDSGALAIGAATTDYMDLYVTVIRVSSSVVRVFVSATSNFSALSGDASYVEVTGLTLANTQVLKITGTAAGVGGASNQLTAKEGFVQWLPAA